MSKTEQVKPKQVLGSIEKNIAAQKRKYEKILAEDSDLVVSSPGSFVGKTSRRVVVKEKGKRVKEIPFFRLKNILITSVGISFSSNLVKYCAEEGIPITFFDSYGRPYAQVLSPKSPVYRLSLAQTLAFTNGKGVYLARSFAVGKIKNQIKKLAKDKNALILAHNYQVPEIQEIADYLGDSLELAKISRNLKEDVIVFCGVRFMAETAKILSPEKKVLLPVPAAGCPLADTITSEELLSLKKENPDSWVVSYVNTSAEIKALSDVCCTSSNAVKVVRNIPADKELVIDLLLKVSKIGWQLIDHIDQMDLNPVFVYKNNYCVVDAKLILK